MSYPIYPNKQKLDSMLTPEEMLESRRLQGSLRTFRAPETVVFCMYGGILKNFSWKYPSRRVKGFLGDLYLLADKNGATAVMGNFGLGAPVTVALAEEMAAIGSKRILLLGSAGGLQPDLTTGDVLICERAIRDEGTSYHYLPAEKYASASPRFVSELAAALSRNGINHSTGTTWSTDAPYRETREEALHFGKEGVAVVDMESAGLFAMGQARGIETASILVIGDSLAGPGWTAPANARILRRRLEALMRVLIGI